MHWPFKFHILGLSSDHTLLKKKKRKEKKVVVLWEIIDRGSSWGNRQVLKCLSKSPAKLDRILYAEGGME